MARVTAYTQAGTDARIKETDPGVRAFETVTGLLGHASPADLPKVVITAGHTTASDGAGLVLTNETWTPDPTHVYGRIGIPLRGRWFIPRNIPTAPRTSPVKPAVDAMLARAQTYVDAGTALEWNADVLTPLVQGGPQRTPSGRWGLTCSSFVGMVLSGLAYQDTTYVASSNTRRDPRVQFGRLVGTDPWQAHRMARWALANGAVWIPVASDWQPGDVLFWGKQEPEGPGTTGKYFLNIYHVAIYAGNGMLYQSKSASDPQGVMHEPLAGMPDEIVLAWRPQYNTPVGTGDGTGATTQALEAEVSARQQAVSELDGRLTALEAEVSARQQAVSELDGRLTALEANGGLVPEVNRLDAGRLTLDGTPVTLANGMSAFDIVFDRPFTTVPRVSLTVGKPGTPSSTLTVRMGECTETGFRVWVNGLVATGWVDWLATDASRLPVGSGAGSGPLVLGEGDPVPDGTPAVGSPDALAAIRA